MCGDRRKFVDDFVTFEGSWKTEVDGRQIKRNSVEKGESTETTDRKRRLWSD